MDANLVYNKLHNNLFEFRFYNNPEIIELKETK